SISLQKVMPAGSVNVIVCSEPWATGSPDPPVAPTTARSAVAVVVVVLVPSNAEAVAPARVSPLARLTVPESTNVTVSRSDESVIVHVTAGDVYEMVVSPPAPSVHVPDTGVKPVGTLIVRDPAVAPVETGTVAV